MSKICADCRHWNCFDLRCKELGWPVAASNSCEKWKEAKKKEEKEECDCPPKCQNECAGCSGGTTQDVLESLADIMGDLDD